ncbi:MAG: hypothetical protein FJ387_23075 [Verrucomicrobia bacterium]|nr:hypothetical protein [Verrucomicrobiota bacterium]
MKRPCGFGVRTRGWMSIVPAGLALGLWLTSSGPSHGAERGVAAPKTPTPAQPQPPPAGLSPVSRPLRPPASAPLQARPWTILERGPHHRVWECVTVEAEGANAPIAVRHVYTELASGLHRWDERAGAWRETRAQFERTPGGHFVARQTAHQLIVAPNLNTHAAVDLLTPDGQRLRSTPLGLALIDLATGDNVLLAELQDCKAEPPSESELLYCDAFHGLRADVRLRLDRGGFEADVILREQPSLPPGFDPATTRLQVLTEFFDAPAPTKRVRDLTSPAVAPQRVERSGGPPGRVPNPEARFPLVDEELDFGSMRIGAGQAFRLEGQPASISASAPAAGSAPVGRGGFPASVPVGKSWELLEGRRFLIESVQWPDLEALVQELPQGATVEGRPRGAGLRQLPAARGARYAQLESADETVPGAAQFAARPTGAPGPMGSGAGASGPGVVLDYTLRAVEADFTFREYQTYLVTGAVNLSGTTTFEGPTVVKFAKGTYAALYVGGPVQCRTGPYRPAIFTALDDNSVGTALPGSSGTPTGWYAYTALRFTYPGAPVRLEYLRVAHAGYGVVVLGGSGHAVRHSQFLNCHLPLYFLATQAAVLNGLFHQIGGPVIYGNGSTLEGQHWTVDGASHLVGAGALNLYNSVLVGLRNPGVAYGGSHNLSPLAVETFVRVGGGHHYMRPESPCRRAGRPDLSGELPAELRHRTTAPPQELLGAVRGDLALEVSVARGGATPDLGYHYEPMDYLVAGLALSEGRFRVKGGLVLGIADAQGVVLGRGAQWVSDGSPQRPNRLIRPELVQEGPNPAGSAGVTGALIRESASAPPAPQLEFRFTELRAPDRTTALLLGGNRAGQYRFRDCQWYGGTFSSGGSPDSAAAVLLNNCLFERVTASFGQGGSPWAVHVYNSLFRSCSLSLNAPAVNGWAWRDNLFENTYLWQYYGGVPNSHNGYLDCPWQLSPAGAANVVLPAPPGSPWVYWPGPLGSYYQAPNGPLLDRGSRSAAAAGLYHYTVHAGPGKEGPTPVDIGLHYVATANGSPVDTDGDGVPDYLEDANGNGGPPDAGETGWQTYDSPNGLGSAGALEVFTLLH